MKVRALEVNQNNLDVEGAKADNGNGGDESGGSKPELAPCYYMLQSMDPKMLVEGSEGQPRQVKTMKVAEG